MYGGVDSSFIIYNVKLKIMGKFDLVVLPYAPGALEPVISAQTLSFHHGKHLQAYVDNLNKLLPGSWKRL